MNTTITTEVTQSDTAMWIALVSMLGLQLIHLVASFQKRIRSSKCFGGEVELTTVVEEK